VPVCVLHFIHRADAKAAIVLDVCNPAFVGFIKTKMDAKGRGKSHSQDLLDKSINDDLEIIHHGLNCDIVRLAFAESL
jgi:hypothetical protein